MKIIFSGGGTLGPVIPLLAIAERLAIQAPELHRWWCGTFTGIEKQVVTPFCHRYVPLANGKLRRYFSFRNLVDPFLVAAGFIESLFLLIIARPRAVVSAGGFVAVPLVWAAWLLRIPSYVFQLDVSLGLAARLTFPFASKKIFIFPPRRPFIPTDDESKTLFPVRQRIADLSQEKESQRILARKQFNLRDGMPVLLCIGGGTGAQSLNDAITGLLPELLAVTDIIHITGMQKGESARATPGYYPVPFLGDDIALAYAAADLVLTRAGMGTIAELAAVQAPALLLPLPHSAQEENAAYLVGQGAAVSVQEKEGFPLACLAMIQKLLNDNSWRSSLGNRLHEIVPTDNGAQAAEIILPQEHSA